MSDTCKHCHDPVTWITTSIGGRIPIDPKPMRLYVELRPRMWQRVFCYQSHLDTCRHRQLEERLKSGGSAS